MSTTKFVATARVLAQATAFAKEKGLQILSLDPSTTTGFHENASWAFIRFSGTHEAGASLLVSLSVSKTPKVHCHVDLSGVPGFIPLPKKNGKIVCHFDGTMPIAPALERLLGASKRDRLPASQNASQATVSAPSSATPITDVFAINKATQDRLDGEAELNSWADSEVDSDEAEMAYLNAL